MKRFGDVKVFVAVMFGIMILVLSGAISVKDASAQTTPSSWRVTGSVFHPIDSSTTYSSPGGGSIYATANPTGLFETPVYLPQGAIIRWVRMYYTNNDATNQCNGWLTVYDLYGNIATINNVNQEWVVTSNVNSGNAFNDTGTINHTVDYAQYSYVLNWRPNVASTNMQLCGFRIFYTAPPSKTVVIPLN